MGEQFADNIDLLGRQVLGEVREPGDVTAGTRQALHKTEADRVCTIRHDDRILLVALLAARLAGTGADTITLGWRRTSSAAKAGRRSRKLSA
jgi:hypothetical protein